MSESREIQIKCKGADHLSITKLLDFQGGLKTLSKKNREKLQQSILKHGFNAPIFVWNDSGQHRILDGHGRLKTLKHMAAQGYIIPDLPVDYIQASTEAEAREKLLHITSQYGEFQLDELNEWIKNADHDIMESLRLVEGELELQFSKKPKETINDDYVPEIKKPVTEKGDLWELGNHRLLCGDSTQAVDVSKLMNGFDADLVWTDPPYNVAYEGAAGTIQNDDMADRAFYEFLLAVYNNYFEVLKPGGCIYVAHADTEGANFRQAFKDSGLLLKQCLVWVKNTAPLSRQDYNWRHEPILYGWKPGAAHYYCQDFTETTVIEGDKPIQEMSKKELLQLIEIMQAERSTSVIEVDRPSKSELHPTMKPVILVEKMIENSSQPGEAVADFFGGSGTTLIAGEKKNRITFLMELDEHFCDIIVGRFYHWCKDNGLPAEIKRNGEIYDAEWR